MGSDATTRRRFLGLMGGVMMGGPMLSATASAHAGTRERRAYIGTYTDAGGRGVLLARADASGVLSVETALSDIERPSFLAAPPHGRRLYAVSEVAEGQVFALDVARDGSLSVLNHQPTHGDSPAHLSVHPSGRHLLSANFFGGNIAVHPIREDGTLAAATDVVAHEGSGPKPDQKAPHPHQIVTDPAGRFILVTDLGNDTVYVYRLDPHKGRLHEHSTVKVNAGAGPRHLAFHPNGRVLYVICELDSTVAVFDYDGARGRLKAGQVVSTVPAGAGDNYPGEILVSGDGRFVYGTNRGHDSVAVFTTGEAGRSLRLTATVPCGGVWPRHMTLADRGRLMYVSNQKSGDVTSFRVDGATLTPGAALTPPAPVCVLPRF
jgi:6-phosphogluconolactonase